MRIITINVNTFTYDFPICIVEENKPAKIIGYSTIDSMGQALLTLCYSHDIDNITIFGKQDFCEPIVETINNLNHSQYSTQKDIRIEVLE